ncbi:metalloendopeptidase [Trichonephila inaurata madagascariensis]|uniref:Metalloendopeptidase n=1 Tax=Trichonephila inaurata madagascariensis TaxID=2747483 RepID=A0A8X6XR64_9ARAC|nr:metalloendopeptidase [Trichonephila inaurata madagascariensis]
MSVLTGPDAFANNPMENEGLFEGDIAGIDPYILTDRNAVVDEAQLWPDGIVHYEIDWKLRDVKDILEEAFKEYETKTCVRFKPKTPATKDYIKLTIVTGCWSSVGRRGGEQEISLSEGCHDKVSAVHEIGHARSMARTQQIVATFWEKSSGTISNRELNKTS